ncbi:E3 ubiquitin-protein ligase RZFP34-like isoform X1 [Humulus lupulus]|uniref:E3 ubiquitin-protein ligase RZFP34-like isoform X1 n=1 Tax=Humulus lupulus TaxID=3486 RepID=UPI002B40677A|nr:E3 ubiquitin-protein ligase RZFP34-like isoform X1 [Humulus lupulus]XP_062117372.1 E3 ubiquitin-protein ligase RZFP34-like isoform X1 [Humulus lupulus]XP_062117373.1 E3 ubiquitin-protein ligase RZFP34-like isoform X1 [Humulus lupulus]XP_062117374.1 E3 ubiquitin-protein ligase RZFP34-like isoform X1 [Humulus lupulus]
MEMGCKTLMAIESSQEKDQSLMELESEKFGCSHYRRRCKIRAPCCDEIFDCRHCHNESKNSLEVDPLDRHDIPRHDLKRVICSLCSTEQDVQQHCIQCGVCMGNYFCSKCKFFDDDVSKNQYHCNECGICRLDTYFCSCVHFHYHLTSTKRVNKRSYLCLENCRVGGKENFFHCNKCGCCYSTMLKDSHSCVEKAMHHNCPVCFEYLFETMKDITVLPCGHTIHLECVKEMEQHLQYSCPVCSKSYCDMTRVWEKLDQEIALTPMPEMYQNKMVWILCNDCGENSEVHFHVVAHKCLKCKSYNTRQTQGGPSSCSSRFEEMVR